MPRIPQIGDTGSKAVVCALKVEEGPLKNVF